MRYNPSLDGVRAVAVSLVVCFHAKVPWMPGGYIGVDVFFVLSGYLITSLLLTELKRDRTIDLIGFFGRRMLRLSPALWLLLAVYVAGSSWLFPGKPFSVVLRDCMASLMYFSDYTQALFGYPDALSHTWSLSVEEHFYLLWPLLLLFVHRKSGGDRVRAGLFVATAFLMFMLATNWRLLAAGLGQSWLSMYYRFDTHVGGILLGCLLGAVLSWRPPREEVDSGFAAGLTQLGLVACLVAVACKMTWMSWGYPQGFLTGIEFVSVSLIGSLAMWPRAWGAAVLSWAPLRYLGRISYGIYLWNFPIVYVLHAWRPHMTSTEMLVISASLNVLLASASWFTVERAAQRLKPMTYAALRHKPVADCSA